MRESSKAKGLQNTNEELETTLKQFRKKLKEFVLLLLRLFNAF
jgi:hypothetical protein